MQGRTLLVTITIIITTTIMVTVMTATPTVMFHKEISRSAACWLWERAAD
jgi:hypothetical protein